MIHLTNTLTRNKESFEPAQAGIVTLYTCGPTVYDYAHIGNLRAFIFDDTLRRVLELSDYNVRHVMNITDVGHLVSDDDEGEDKLEKGAKREGKTVWDVAKHYTDAFKLDMEALRILPPNAYKDQEAGDTYARATRFIAEQQNMVERLLAKGLAYITEQAIYFDVTRLPSYGALSGQKLADKEVGARSEVVTDPDKRHPYDFAVWFFTVGRYLDHTMHWPSPWGDGFPGWHLECSAIIHATLGDPIDIHTGGVDHIGTHHPNEMAQTEGAFGHPLARYWLHNEFILSNGMKMSKSKGNYFTLSNIIERGMSPLAFRLLVLQAHYRSELNFTWKSLSAAQNFLLRLYAWADTQFQPNTTDSIETNRTKADELANAAWASMLSSVQDDLNTPEALAGLSRLIDLLEASGLHLTEIPNWDKLLQNIDRLFALGLSARQDILPAQKELIRKREQARIEKDFTLSDSLRSQLQALGLEVEDTARGPVWRRNNIV